MQQASLCRWIKKFQFDFVLGKCVCSCGGEILQNPGEGGLPCCSQGHEVEDCNTELWPAAGIFTIVLLLAFFLNDPVDTCERDDRSDNIEKGHSNVLPKASLTC